ncbi:MotA/TolQ/ExbB proton channel family protein [Klebsiella variicola]|uniref:MotA/TolQ/ExbB proton channel family protein n=2 Tax=Klebsiella variicola TaxID=244366 RepID=UPI000E2D0A6E|nr:MotA/TolQ/ExbB proton channel family protein [Klebsiella variicola]SXG02827.1 colicin uptake protein TolQ [Klebsiella variicola]HCI5738443.1 MotA/TolQ/ExbB proton channel family protein [Klebsiella variicola subsp. variicola]HCI6877875.1 MotA/TolQ/ExbB proton channel family protein [Klebsiella quasipneumoniae subsp. similipneumoniae]HED4010343.1 MotA/TolQ/ExbB proton channel family protein [Klebsiella variicola subsp. variicola]
MNTLDFAHFWQQGDAVTHGVAIMLLAMSLLSWTVLAVKSLQLLALHKSAAWSRQRFWQAASLPEGAAGFGRAAFNPFRDLAIEGQALLKHPHKFSSTLGGHVDLSDWLVRGLSNVLDSGNARLQSGLGILASVGSTAPFVGLLGTVWGIFHALQTISAIGQPDISQVAGPVGEALIMTAFGLFVAIPAVLGYNAISRRNRTIHQAMNRFAHDLHAFLLTGARVESGSVQAVAEPAAPRVVERSA